jgi:hypothetical protein
VNGKGTARADPGIGADAAGLATYTGLGSKIILKFPIFLETPRFGRDPGWK